MAREVIHNSYGTQFLREARCELLEHFSSDDFVGRGWNPGEGKPFFYMEGAGPLVHLDLSDHTLVEVRKDDRPSLLMPFLGLFIHERESHPGGDSRFLRCCNWLREARSALVGDPGGQFVPESPSLSKQS